MHFGMQARNWIVKLQTKPCHQKFHSLFGFSQPHIVELSIDFYGFYLVPFFDHFDDFRVASLRTFKIGDVQVCILILDVIFQFVHPYS